mgnify:FL=1
MWRRDGITKTDFRKALAQADRCKPFYYTETSRSGHEYKYCFLKSREGYTLRNETGFISIERPVKGSLTLRIFGDSPLGQEPACTAGTHQRKEVEKA